MTDTPHALLSRYKEVDLHVYAGRPYFPFARIPGTGTVVFLCICSPSRSTPSYKRRAHSVLLQAAVHTLRLCPCITPRGMASLSIQRALVPNALPCLLVRLLVLGLLRSQGRPVMARLTLTQRLSLILFNKLSWSAGQPVSHSTREDALRLSRISVNPGKRTRRENQRGLSSVARLKCRSCVRTTVAIKYELVAAT